MAPRSTIPVWLQPERETGRSAAGCAERWTSWRLLSSAGVIVAQAQTWLARPGWSAAGP